MMSVRDELGSATPPNKFPQGNPPSGATPDLRDQRGRETPGRWQPQGAPTTANERPSGGIIPARDYHQKGHFTDQNGTMPMPLNNRNQ
jgi:hypothetical protein